MLAFYGFAYTDLFWFENTYHTSSVGHVGGPDLGPGHGPGQGRGTERGQAEANGGQGHGPDQDQDLHLSQKVCSFYSTLIHSNILGKYTL